MSTVCQALPQPWSFSRLMSTSKSIISALCKICLVKKRENNQIIYKKCTCYGMKEHGPRRGGAI